MSTHFPVFASEPASLLTTNRALCVIPAYQPQNLTLDSDISHTFTVSRGFL
jgi:hypothetical protein